MQVRLSDGRDAQFISELSDKMVKIKLPDGREVPYPKDKLKFPEQESQEEELKIGKVPAIDRLEELNNDYDRLVKAEAITINDGLVELAKLRDELKAEALQEFKQKWGL